VEPVDYEELVILYQSVIERDPLRQILEFPLDSVQLELVRRSVRTLAPVIPEHGSVFSVVLACVLCTSVNQEAVSVCVCVCVLCLTGVLTQLWMDFHEMLGHDTVDYTHGDLDPRLGQCQFLGGMMCST